MSEIEQILTGGNLLRAMHQVQRNHGSAGVDHMHVAQCDLVKAHSPLDRLYNYSGA